MGERQRIPPVFRPGEKGLRKVFGEFEAAIMDGTPGREGLSVL